MSLRLLVVLIAALLTAAGTASLASAPDALDGREADLHLLNRAVFGVKPEDVARLRARGADAWLQEQLHPQPEPDLEARLALFHGYGLSPREVLMQQYENRYEVAADGRREVDTLAPVDRLIERQLLMAAESRNQLRELMVDFWFNHFNVCVERKDLIDWSLPSYVEQGLRPHALGRFRDLLGAVAKHPAMLVYLDNWISSAHGDGGVNENYARELLELHTVGAYAGYTQADIRAVALVFTGWTTIDRGLQDTPSQDCLSFHFDPGYHAPGKRHLPFFGVTLEDGGVEQGEAVLDLLARHPATAHRIVKKLATRFVDDQPPAELVERGAQVWLRTDGDLAAVMECLLTSPEFRQRGFVRSKLKTPFELVAGTLRVLEAPVGPGMANAETHHAGEIGPVDAMERLGEPIFRCLTPNGYPERAVARQHPAALAQRYETMAALSRRYAPLLARRHGDTTNVQVARRLLPTGMAPSTAEMVVELGDFAPADAASQVLSSPDFQLR